jgi:hypothetical protein
MSRNPATSQDNRQRSRPSKGKASPIRKSPNARQQGADGAPRTPGGLQAFHLQHIDRLLGKVLLFARPSDAVVSHYFRENSKLGHRDRASSLKQFLQCCADASNLVNLPKVARVRPRAASGCWAWPRRSAAMCFRRSFIPTKPSGSTA